MKNIMKAIRKMFVLTIVFAMVISNVVSAAGSSVTIRFGNQDYKDVDLDGSISLVFSEAVTHDVGRVTIKNPDGNDFESYDLSTSPVECNWSNVGGKDYLEMNPANKFAPSTAYTVVVSSFKDLSNQTITDIGAQPYAFETKPAATKMLPNDSEDVAISTDIVIEFTEPMVKDDGSITISNINHGGSDAKTFNFSGTGNTEGTVGFSADRKTVTLDPDSDFQPDKIYDITFSGVKSVANDVEVWEDLLSAFHTASAPTVTLTTPLTNATGVSVNTDLIFEFDENMAVAYGGTAVTLTAINDANHDVTYTKNETTATWVNSKHFKITGTSLAPGETYTVSFTNFYSEKAVPVNTPNPALTFTTTSNVDRGNITFSPTQKEMSEGLISVDVSVVPFTNKITDYDITKVRLDKGEDNASVYTLQKDKDYISFHDANGNSIIFTDTDTNGSDIKTIKILLGDEGKSFFNGTEAMYVTMNSGFLISDAGTEESPATGKSQYPIHYDFIPPELVSMTVSPERFNGSSVDLDTLRFTATLTFSEVVKRWGGEGYTSDDKSAFVSLITGDDSDNNYGYLYADLAHGYDVDTDVAVTTENGKTVAIVSNLKASVLKDLKVLKPIDIAVWDYAGNTAIPANTLNDVIVTYDTTAPVFEKVSVLPNTFKTINDTFTATFTFSEKIDADDFLESDAFTKHIIGSNLDMSDVEANRAAHITVMTQNDKTVVTVVGLKAQNINGNVTVNLEDDLHELSDLSGNSVPVAHSVPVATVTYATSTKHATGSGSSGNNRDVLNNQFLSRVQTSETIRRALGENKTPVIELGDMEAVEFNGQDLFENAKNKRDLILKGKGIEIVLPASLIDSWNITEGSIFKYTLSPNKKAIPQTMLDKLGSMDELNKKLLDLIYEIEAEVDGKIIEGKDSQYKITMDVEDFKLNALQKKMFTGLYYDKDLSTYIQLGGEFSEDGKKFSFFTPYMCTYGVAVSDHLKAVRLTIGSENYTLNGVLKVNDIEPLIENGRTMLPLRMVAESLEADIEWIQETRTVLIKKDETILQLQIDVPLPDNMGTPIIRNDRTLVPIRYIAEKLGANVIWNAEAKTVDIYQ